MVSLHAPIVPHGGSLDADLLSVGVPHDTHSTCATPVHDSRHGPSAQPGKRASAHSGMRCMRWHRSLTHVPCAGGSHRWILPTRTPLGAFQRAAMCARACVTWAGGVLTAVHSRYRTQRAWIACDEGRWRRQADLRRELRCLVCLRRPNLRKPPHAAAHSGAVRTRRTDDRCCRVLQRALR